MDRENKEFTVGEHKYIVKTYATAREHQAIQTALFAGTKFEITGETPKINEFSPAVLFEMQKETIRQLVVKMDESPDNIVDRALELPSDQFEELVAKLDELIAKKK